MRRLITLLLVAIAVAVGVAGARLWWDWQQFPDRPLPMHDATMLWLDSGSNYRGMVRQLELLGLATFDWRWRLLGRLHQPVLRAGEYRIEAGTTMAGLLEQLARGEVRKHRFTVVEGWTLAQLRRELAADIRLRRVATDLDDEALMARLGCGGCPAEGRFLPETYFFVRGSTDLELLGRAHQALEEALERVWSERDPELPLSDPEELLVLASLIERETGQAAERTRIAGVFVRRLERGMRLQTDPTVSYGLGEDFDGRLRRVHLRTDHPWNTYTRHGLPPTPIALAGRAALEAAAHPADGSALYFVSRGDGTHHFSDSLAEHNAAVDRYIRGRR